METDESVGSQGVRYSIPQNGTPEFLESGFNTFKLIFETYGWFLLIAVSGVIYLYHKYKPSYDKWNQQKEYLKDVEEKKKNPEQAYTIQIKMEDARRKLQERVSTDSAVRRARESELEEQKRREKIEEWEKHKQGKGYHSKSKAPEKSPDENVSKPLKPNRKNEFRPQFNPLSGGGGGGSSGYRPSRRSGGG